MSNSSAKGSILLKILILICIAMLIAVIKIPDQIWTEENNERSTAIENITSIYESLKYYHRITGDYTTDPAELIRVVRKDSSLLQQQQVVNYTQELRETIDSYLKIPYISALAKMEENVRSILEDIEINTRYLKINQDILNEAEDLKIKLAELHNDGEFPYYVKASTYLDSLIQIRRDLSDYTLQTASARFAAMTDTLQKVLGMIELDKIEARWMPLDKRFETFVRTVMYTDEVKETTNVHDRIADFKKKITTSLQSIQAGKMEADIEKAGQVTDALKSIYQEFLKDFIITSRTAQYSLSKEDSMVLHLTEDNFYSPVHPERQLQYRILIDPDSGGVKVESPVLLESLHEKIKPLLAETRQLPFMPSYKAYLDTVDSIMSKTAAIKKRLRKNTDIFIKNKEIEEVYKKIPGISEFEAYYKVIGFLETADSSESFSEIKEHLENCLTGIRIYRQMYSENLFPNIDSLNKDLMGHLQEYNQILADVRRLPKDITNFENEILSLQQLIADIKNVPAGVVEQQIIPIENDVAVALKFAVDGDTEPVYGIFSKNIENFGYIYKDFKSWEEE